MTLSPRILKDIVAIEREYGEQIQGLIDQKREAIAKALGAEAARSTGGQLGPGTPPDTSWNKRASPPGGEWQGIDTASQSLPSGDGAQPILPPSSEPSAASEIESEDALIDFISDALETAADYDMGWRDYAKRVAQALVAASAVRFT